MFDNEFSDVSTIDFDPHVDDPYDRRSGQPRTNSKSMLTFYIIAFCGLIGGGLLFRLLTTGF